VRGRNLNIKNVHGGKKNGSCDVRERKFGEGTNGVWAKANEKEKTFWGTSEFNLVKKKSSRKVWDKREFNSKKRGE